MHHDGSSIAAPVTNELTIRIMMGIGLMANWAMKIVDIKGAFLRGEFEEGQETADCVLELLKFVCLFVFLLLVVIVKRDHHQ